MRSHRTRAVFFFARAFTKTTHGRSVSPRRRERASFVHRERIFLLKEIHVDHVLHVLRS